ncbi:Synaptojanin [Entamoeba marina]
MGDLNYRIDLTDFEVRKFMKTKNYIELYKHDQLIESLRKRLVFNNFKEQQINFAPTFKIKIGENVYKDNRVPAWCDRVLYKTENRHHVEVKEYMSYEIYCSDHKPVTCLLSMHLREINQQKQSIKNIMKLLYQKIKLSTKDVVFDDVEIMKEYTQTVQLKNYGKFMVEYEVLEATGDIYEMDWLTIKKCYGIVDIFEKKDYQTLQLHIKFKKENLWMCQDTLFLSKTIKIKLGEGKILSFSVHVKTRPSIIGMSLNSLLYLNKPLIGESLDNIYTQTPFIIPKEIYRLSDYIIKNHEINCFEEREQLTCENDRIHEILSFLNTEKPFKPYAVGLYCEVLLIIIGGLRYPIFPNKLTGTIKSDLTKLLHIFKCIVPDSNRRLLVYLLSFIKKLLSFGEAENTLLNRFVPHIFRCYDQENVNYHKEIMKKLLNQSMKTLLL